MSIETVNQVFYQVVDRQLDRVMLYKQTVKWIPISSRELYRDAVGIARALTSWGIAKGDRVAILSENRPEWATAEFGTLLFGGAIVPIYPTLTSEQSAFMLADSGARVAFVSTVDQLKKLQAVQSITKLEKIVVMDYIGIPDAIPMHRLMHDGPVERDAAFDAAAHAIRPDDLATIIYTSGTTGTPKGAMLTQGNLASNLLHSLDSYPLGPDDVSLSFLPLSHITARHVDYAMFYHGVTIAYCPYIDQLKAALPEIRPTIFVAVPRVYEKIRGQAEAQTKSGWKHKVYQWALKVGRAHRDEILAGKLPTSPDWKLADRFVFSKIRQALGGRIKIYISGGAPLGRDLAEWYAGVGIRIHEGYGLTETSPVIALNKPTAYKIGTVGRPLRNVEVRIADDGEILVRGPSVFKGYWNMPAETAAALTPEGWFKTGDIGNLDSDGFLSVTDRKKDLIKTSGGKFIAPQPIERKLQNNAYVGEAIVIGDRRKFPSVVIAPDFTELERWARENGLGAQSREELVRDERVCELFDGIVAEVNRDLAQFEKLKKVLLVADEFSVADGSLTPTLKLKRRVVEERYRQHIQQLYENSDNSTTPADVAAGSKS
ncbi:MAG: long-chain fatty acid--CoA ligase [Terriglobales bacterium]|jgi:long-chain acyl-CoA synthetase